MKKCIPNREGRSAAIMPTVLTSMVLAIAGSALPYFCANKTEIVARDIALLNNSSLLSSLLVFNGKETRMALGRDGGVPIGALDLTITSR
jgi:hypothetical protein